MYAQENDVLVALVLSNNFGEAGPENCSLPILCCKSVQFNFTIIDPQWTYEKMEGYIQTICSNVGYFT